MPRALPGGDGQFSTDSKAYDSIIWNNCNIKIDGKPICYHNYMNAGIIFINDYCRHNVESFNIAKDNGLIGSNYLTHGLLFVAMCQSI